MHVFGKFVISAICEVHCSLLLHNDIIRNLLVLVLRVCGIYVAQSVLKITILIKATNDT